MAVDVLKRIPVREQDPKVRATNFEEVCYGYNKEEAMDEASRCLGCKNAKCIQGCPVNINIPGFIAQIKEGKMEEAYKVIGESSALPAICGRVCPQESQCESKCIRGIKGEAVSIGKLERFVADYALENDIKPAKAESMNGHKVAVIGSGPSGLTCAGDLAKLGYDVTVFEALHELGGVLVYGIPEFRLPKQKVVKKEIEKVKELGVKFETNVVIGKSTTIDQLIEDEKFEAVFIGSGAGLPMFMGIPGETANGVFSANEYLTRSNLMKAFDDSYDTPIAAGKKVCVVGGGNVAMDAARTALRLGAEVHIVYRRSEAELPARAEEVHHAKEEGIIFDLLTNPKEITVDENGWVKGMKVVKMELGEPDASGRRRPVEIDGSEYEIACDTVIMSLGTSPNPLISSTTKGLETNRRKCIVASEENGQTSKAAVFAGGDAVTGAATVILAMGAGKAGAKGIHEYLSQK
ncbi:MAG: NADPH-dependent glutamate synthase [Blautia sp.]|nr:NADPH-dependent glutamate synthase [Blautia sp.]MDY5031958.1 NADPH-dependent glutamate synthase [Blautia sp.]